MVSGGFDPIHVGHIRLFKDASRYGSLIVVLNSDEWLMRKKDFIFMPLAERAEIITSLACVYMASGVNDEDGTVCEALNRLRPAYFANGGDRAAYNTPEIVLCNSLGINLLWNVGGGKVQSSSDLAKNAK